MSFSTVLVTPPAIEPVTLEECKDLLGLPDSEHEQDATLYGMIRAARIYCERYLKRQFITATWDYRNDCFPSWGFELPLPPLQSVTSVKYVDVGGVTQTLDPATYVVDSFSEPARISPEWNQTWPSARYTKNAVTIRFVAGYGATAPSVPDTIRQAIKKHVQMQFDEQLCDEWLMAIHRMLGAEMWGCYV